ncbi:MAG: PorP/SprF family type IX secretion system membrane protein [Bacteroidales bacterium]|jgi:type IX secretion system PorP/SprF family membrane protein|nr:PorP/SprF family type IX secretion system membrane protein [Bacteroidales bacterium]MDX9798428.1 PorP/SprF family type IX secretion system membrane protein [Bacteroidales bacterium]
MVGKLKLFFIVFTLGFCSIQSFGQDVHFSTFDANPMLLNPANTAFGSNLFRAGTIYRNQWSTVSQGYNSYLISAEALPYSSRIRKHGVGVGVRFLADVAGTLRYGQKSIGLSASYFKAINASKEHYISFGIEGNTSSWGYDLTNSVFGRYPEDREGILLNNVTTFDFGLGTHWQMKANDKHYLQAGVALFHINQPSLSYYENTDIILPMRFNAYFSDLIMIKYDNFIKPTIYFQSQKEFIEVLIGGDYCFNVAQTSLDSKIISIGAYYRALDALIVMGKYRFNDFNVGVSYDINLSKLTPASKTYGGVEIWLLYSFNPSGYKRTKTSIPCPAF